MSVKYEYRRKGETVKQQIEREYQKTPEGKRAVAAAAKAKKKKTPPPPPKVASNWRSIIIGGGAATGNVDYHTGGAGVAGRGGWHTGEDIGAAHGGSFGKGVHIPLGGTVVEAGWGAGGGSAFGNAVLVKLDNGDYMYFAHLSTINVKKGDKLKPNSFVGRVGATGNTSGPHLHLEIRRAASNGKWQRTDSTFYNPVTYLDRVTKGMKYDLSGEPKGGTTPDKDTSKVTGDTTTTTTTDSSGVGIGMGKVGFSKKEFYADLETMFGDLNTLLKMDDAAMKENGGKSIRWAIDEAVKQKITDPDRFLTLLNKTAWFSKYGQETSKRMVLEKSKPKLFQSELNKTKADLQAMAAEKGIVLNKAALDSIARNVYVFQWDQSPALVLDKIQAASNSDQVTYAGGDIGKALEALDTYARDFGVQMSDADVRQLRNDILDGIGAGRVQETLQERSAQTYSVFGEQLRKGVSLRTLTDPYLRVAGDLLEVSPEEMDMTDPLFTQGRAFQTVDPASGKIVQRTLADFQDMVRSDVRWQKTENAKKTASEMASGILKQMGLM